MSNDYYAPSTSEYDIYKMVPFREFMQDMRSLEHRNRRLELRRLSLRSDLLKLRCSGIGIEFRHLMQADFILFLRDHIDGSEDTWYWWPETLLYTSHNSSAFEVFARSRSSTYFERSKVLLGIDTKEELQPLFEKFAARQRNLPYWNHHSFSPIRLLGFSEITTKP